MNKLGRELEMTTVKKDLLTIGIVGFLLFMLGNWAIAITDPVESNYTLTAVEMLRSGDYIHLVFMAIIGMTSQPFSTGS